MTSNGQNLRRIRPIGRLLALILGGAAGVALPFLLGLGLYRCVAWLLRTSGW